MAKLKENEFVPADVKSEYSILIKGGPVVVLPGSVAEIDLRAITLKDAARMSRIAPHLCAPKPAPPTPKKGK